MPRKPRTTPSAARKPSRRPRQAAEPGFHARIYALLAQAERIDGKPSTPADNVDGTLAFLRSLRKMNRERHTADGERDAAAMDAKWINGYKLLQKRMSEYVAEGMTTDAAATKVLGILAELDARVAQPISPRPKRAGLEPK